MRPLGHYRAAPVVPSALAPLANLARDFRFAWREEVRAVFPDLDAEAWSKSGGNPVEFLKLVSPALLSARAADAGFVAHVAAVAERLRAEDDAPPAVAEAARLLALGGRVAYFCAEFGVSEILPIYSGGLGVLAGDHLKSASDLGVPLVGVGLFYREGFFQQLLAADGRQREAYPIVDPDDLPLDLLPTPNGEPPIVRVRIADRDVYLLVRRARIGRVPLLLLDSHHPYNRAADREITSRLYGGNGEPRIQQEIVLGVGGMRALDLAGLRPTVRHANEGHASFLGLEKIRQLRDEAGLSFDEAREVASAGNVFTTHTPVPAGIDLFAPELMRRYFEKKVEAYGLSFDAFLGLGRQVPEDAHEHFSMAVLGLRLSAHVNGVSKLHAQVSRRLWRGVFPESPLSEVPIGHVTNGVHAPTWTAPAIAAVLKDRSEEAVDREDLWRRHELLRAQLVQAVRERTAQARRRRGAPDQEVAAAFELLDPSALTIGFARRFATYKRATLVFSDLPRLVELLADPSRPVQLLFAGKAHPKDEAGKEFLHKVGELAEKPELRGRVVLLENYDMRLARLLVAGADVWLNTPRRPMEASGTSGMKAAMNGVLNLSVLDGWWDEAPRDGAGFAIADATDGRTDEEIAAALYDVLESQVVPLFYGRDGGRSRPPLGWVDRMVRAAKTLGALFSTDRMLVDYLGRAYLPAAERVLRLSGDGHDGARRLAAWKKRVEAAWKDVGFFSVQLTDGSGLPVDPARVAPGETFQVDVTIRLGALDPVDVAVDWFEGALDPDGVVDAGFSTPLSLVERTDGRATYQGAITRPDDDTRGYSVRLRPSHPDLAHANELGLVIWAG